MGAAHKVVVVLCSGEDGYVVAECPALPGTISQGKSEAEALANIREAIELALESGDVPKRPLTSKAVELTIHV